MTFSALFECVLQASISAALLVPVILLLKRLLKEKMDARWHYCVWLLLVARLLMPFAPESALSVFNAVPVQKIVVLANRGSAGSYDPLPAPPNQGNLYEPGPGQSAGEPPESTVPGPAEPAGGPPAGEHTGGAQPAGDQSTGGETGGKASTGSGAAAAGILRMIWLGGAAALALYLLFLNGKLWLKYRKAALSPDPYLAAVVAECKRELGVKRNPAVIVCSEIKSPALYGFLRPKLLLPAGLAGNLERAELRCILLHELAHLKRADIAVYWLTGLLQALHWFNPLVWHAFYRMRQDAEAACDALVLSRFSRAERIRYGRTMIKLAATGGGTRPVPLPGLAGIVEEESQIKRRITMISRFKKSSIALTIAGVILLTGLAVFFLTNARSDNAMPGGLGTPAKMIIYRGETALPVDRDSDGFAELWEAAGAAVQSGAFDAAAAPELSEIEEYMIANSVAAGLEIIYDEPLELNFAEKRIVRRLFIDLDNAYFFIWEANDGSYGSDAFPLAKIGELRAALESVSSSATFSVTVEADPAAGGQVKGGGRYRGGEEIIVEAIPAEGYLFAGWKVDGESTVSHDKKFKCIFGFNALSNSELTIFKEDTNLVAVFEKIEGTHFDRWSFDFETWDIIPRLSPDGQRLLGLRGSDLLLYKFPDQALLNTFTAGDQCQVKEFHWHPRGDAFAYFEESAQKVHLYLVKLNGERKKIISFDQAKHGPSTISLEGLSCRVGWMAWALQGEAVAVQTRSDEALRFYLVDLNGKILLEEKITEPLTFMQSPLASNDGRQIAFSLFGPSGENLWLWDLRNGHLRQITEENEGDYPFHWVDNHTLMIEVGAIGTGGGSINGLAIVDLNTGSRRMVDYQTGRMNLARSISPGGKQLMGGSCTHEGDNVIYVLNLENGRREVIRQGHGLELDQVLWQTEKMALMAVSQCKDESYDISSIQQYIRGRECVPLVERQRCLQILDARDGILHYLESNETGSHWIWKTGSM